MHLFHGQGLGHFQVDGGGPLLHALLVVEVRQLHLVLEVLGIQLHDLGELLQGPLDEPLAGADVRHLDVDLDGFLDHVGLAVEFRQALGHFHVLRGDPVGLLQHGGGLGVEPAALEAGPGLPEQVHGLGHLAGLQVGVAHPVQQVVVVGRSSMQLEELLDGPVHPAGGHVGFSRVWRSCCGQ